jgi:hypothetical protein
MVPAFQYTHDLLPLHSVCGDELIEGSEKVDNSQCNMACGGNSTYVD